MGALGAEGTAERDWRRKARCRARRGALCVPGDRERRPGPSL